MKTINSLKFLAASLCALALTAGASAATWNGAYGIGNPGDDANLYGSGVDLAVIASVQSNSLYYVTSAHASGGPRISSTLIKPDLTGCTLRWYTATNSYTVGTASVAGSNQIWLSATNAGLATNDLLVIQDVNNDAYQLVILGGGSTSATGLVATNGAQNLIKLWNTVSNAVSVGDKVWKLAQVSSLTPLTLGNVTNDVASPWANSWQLSTRAAPIVFSGPAGSPSAMVLTISNAGSLTVQGDYNPTRIRIR